MADIKRILRKRNLTGRELGILEVSNMAVMFGQSLAGEPQKPLIDRERLQQMINNITDRTQGRIFNGYISIHEWLTLYFNIAQTSFQQAQLRFVSLSSFIVLADVAENIFKYIESLPAIMTEKEYKEAVERNRNENFKEYDGTEIKLNVLGLIYNAIEYYAERLTTEPRKANPLRAIRKQYLTEQITTPWILEEYNVVANKGYYTLPDGRRSDEMTKEEWEAALSTPKMKKTLEQMKWEEEVGVSPEDRTATKLAHQRAIDRAKCIYHGGTPSEAEREQKQREYEAGLATPCEWHYYEDPPANLNKWEVLEDTCTMYDLFPRSLGGYKIHGNDQQAYMREAEAFINEFSTAAEAVLEDIERRYFPGLSSIPMSKWRTTTYTMRQLYDMDYYGAREFNNRYDMLWDENWRALMNGIAILRPTPYESPAEIDENGYYSPPEIRNTVRERGLESFFPEADTYEENTELVEQGRETLLDDYYFLKGYNLAIDLIAEYYEIPDIAVFKMDTEAIRAKIDALNEAVLLLYARINDTVYEDYELKKRKLQVLKERFREIDYSDTTPSEEAIDQVKQLFIDFRAFQETETIANLLMYRPHTEDKRGNADE